MYWYRYWSGEGIIALSKGENNSFFKFEYTPVEEENKPKEILKREQGLSLPEFAHGTGYYMDIEKEDFEALGVENLKIEKREEGHFTWVFTYEDAGCRFNVYKDQRENLEEYLADVSYEQSETEFETLYTYVKEGYGEQVFVNPFGDVWKIAMTGDAGAEKLNAIRTLLEDHSWHKN